MSDDEAIKIMTGARVPFGCVAVIPQEKVNIDRRTGVR
ncbi:MAG: hypothetical protein IE878_06225 [Epsilonproteobacteria bacterium]|nr:hypothetical protein [Campylobacterota bacterium]